MAPSRLWLGVISVLHAWANPITAAYEPWRLKTVDLEYPSDVKLTCFLHWL
jgi:hypothetical protein